MTGWLARQALHLYPLAYRRRYGEEMQALLEDQAPSPGAVLDLLRGALLAHLRPAGAPAGAVDPPDRVRATAAAVLLCWVIFALAGFSFYKTTEDLPFSAAGHAHPLLRDAHLAVQGLAVIASVAVVLGALPLIAAALAHARREPGVRRTVALPFVPVIVFLALSVAFLAVVRIHPGHLASGVGYGIAGVWAIAAVVCGPACVLACRAALFATPVAGGRLRVALGAGTLVTIAMIAIAAATAIYVIALSADASNLASEPNGPFGLLSVSASVIIQVIVMLGAGLLAAVSTVRGWRAQGVTTRAE